MTLLKPHARQFALTLGAVAAGGLLFASGVFVARATDDEDASNDPGDSSKTLPAVRNQSEGGMSTGAAPAADIARGGGGMASDSLLPYWGCSAPIEAALQGTSVDAARLGVTPAMLGSGFQFAGASLRGESGCKGSPDEGKVRVILDTRWRHTETGLDLAVSQAQSADAVAPVVDMGGARFSRDGYAFWLNVMNYGLMPVDIDTPQGGVATTSSPGMPGYDPRTTAVLEAALEQLGAPENQCFYRQRQGTWEELAALGIGDPRPAVPSAFTLGDFSFFRMDAPAAGCNVPALEGQGQLSINAHWYASSKTGGFVNISVSEFAPGELTDQPGRSGQGDYAWNNGKYQFYVSGHDGSGALADSVLATIATALDPNFANRCTVDSETVKFAELEKLGVREPRLPDGFRVEMSTFTRLTAHGDCSRTPKVPGGFRAEWILWRDTLPGGALILNISKGTTPETGFPPNSVFGYGMTWTSGDVTYSIFEKMDADDETVIALAKSVDPTFDISKLSKTDTEPGVRPAIAPDAPVSQPAPTKPR